MGGEGKSHRKKKAGRKAEKRKAAASKKRQDGGEGAAGALSTEQVSRRERLVDARAQGRCPGPAVCCWRSSPAPQLTNTMALLGTALLCSAGLLFASLPWPRVPCGLCVGRRAGCGAPLAAPGMTRAGLLPTTPPCPAGPQAEPQGLYLLLQGQGQAAARAHRREGAAPHARWVL